jgi:hypothetical protein
MVRAYARVVFAADGPAAERMIPRIRDAVRSFLYPNIGDYRVWPGPNSNTFVATVMSAGPRDGRNAAADCHRQGLPR